ncbi:hypothetical protein BRADI_3g59729v3 [Brachypodium distachyon]|uniref:Uncharacterized protein n=1 Tax=Brachypodium distachyon TaxID=15368 RepID=A0A2K2D5V3_BRADI|nr:hypothetical protein BRADI_3g59729v3 [Brachypodium distachyon]
MSHGNRREREDDETAANTTDFSRSDAPLSIIYRHMRGPRNHISSAHVLPFLDQTLLAIIASASPAQQWFLYKGFWRQEFGAN